MFYSFTNQYQSKPIIIDKDGKELTLNREYTIGSYQVDNIDLDHQVLLQSNGVVARNDFKKYLSIFYRTSE